MLATFCVYTGILTVYAENDVQITLDRDVESSFVYGTVSAEGVGADELIELKVQNAQGEIIYMDQLYTDSSGKAAFKYYHLTSGGTITVYARCGDSVGELSFEHVSKMDIDAIFEAIKDSRASKSVEKLRDIFEENSAVLGLDMEIYNRVSDKDAVYKFIIGDTDTEMNAVSDAINEFYAGVSAVAIKEKTISVKALSDKKYYSELFQKEALIPKKNNGTSVLDTLGEKAQTGVFSRADSYAYSKKSEFGSVLCLYTLTEALRLGEWQDVYDLLAAYDSSGYINISFDDYSRLSNKANAAKAMIGKSYSDYADIVRAFKAAVAEEQSKENKSSQSVGSGGGGGGGGSSITMPTVVNTPEPVKEFEPADAASQIKSGRAVFRDMETEAQWAIEAVEYLYGIGIVDGVDENSFEPNRQIKRSEYAKLIAAAARDVSSGAAVHFSDLNGSEWFYPYAVKASELGLMLGDDMMRFNGDDYITREEMAVVVSRLADRLKMTLKTSRTADFDDQSAISDWADEAVTYLRNAGIVNGRNKNSYEPKEPVTRAEACAVLYKLLNKG